MIRSIRSELLKFFTTRLWWGMAIAVVLAGAAFALLFGFIFTSDAANGANGGPPAITNDLDLARQVFTGGIGVGYLLTLAIGVMTIGAEYRHTTVTSTFLANPKRVQVMGAKVVALLIIGAMYAVLSLVGSVVTGTLLLTAKGHAPFADPQIWRTLALALLVMGLWALIGLGVGILIPNQVAGLLIAIDRRTDPGRGPRHHRLGQGHHALPPQPGDHGDAEHLGRRLQRGHRHDAQLVGGRTGPRRLRRGHGRRGLVADGAPRHQLTGAHPRDRTREPSGSGRRCAASRRPPRGRRATGLRWRP
jgi:hypothetical protein